jgi:hypothetical protein
LYLIYVKLHEESIYGQFLTLLQQLMDKMEWPQVYVCKRG